MEYLFICYPKCTTCKKAKKYLNDNGISYNERDITIDNPTEQELMNWIKKSKLPIKRFFNTSGIKYRELGLKDKLTQMNENDKIKLLASDGMLFKRPLLISHEKVMVGFNEELWEEL